MIELVQGDITTFPADAIVNAANPFLMNAGGVAAAIEKAAGPRFVQACSQIDPIPVGDADYTTAGDLPAHFVIHCVGPRYGQDEPSGELLRSAYVRGIEKADELGLQHVAFPSLSTGIFGFPVDEAAPIAIGAVGYALANAMSVKKVSFVLFDKATLEAYEEAYRYLTSD